MRFRRRRPSSFRKSPALERILLPNEWLYAPIQLQMPKCRWLAKHLVSHHSFSFPPFTRTARRQPKTPMSSLKLVAALAFIIAAADSGALSHFFFYFSEQFLPFMLLLDASRRFALHATE
jgi:hypothetical protein